MKYNREKCGPKILLVEDFYKHLIYCQILMNLHVVVRLISFTYHSTKINSNLRNENIFKKLISYFFFIYSFIYIFFWLPFTNCLIFFLVWYVIVHAACRCRASHEQCNPSNGWCQSGCARGWGGRACQIGT